MSNNIEWKKHIFNTFITTLSWTIVTRSNQMGTKNTNQNNRQVHIHLTSHTSNNIRNEKRHHKREIQKETNGTQKQRRPRRMARGTSCRCDTTLVRFTCIRDRRRSTSPNSRYPDAAFCPIQFRVENLPRRLYREIGSLTHTEQQWRRHTPRLSNGYFECDFSVASL